MAGETLRYVGYYCVPGSKRDAFAFTYALAQSPSETPERTGIMMMVVVIILILSFRKLIGGEGRGSIP